jgi:hypothetical protein
MQLYRVDVEILDASGLAMGQVAFDRVGWRRLGRPAPYIAPPRPVPARPQTPTTAPSEPVL